MGIIYGGKYSCCVSQKNSPVIPNPFHQNYRFAAMRPTLHAVVVAAASRLSSSPAVGFSPASSSSSSSLRSKSPSSYRGVVDVVARRPLPLLPSPRPSSSPSAGGMLSATTKDLAESVLRNPKYPPEWPYGPVDFERQDESDDSLFYSQARLVYHIDEYAVSALTEYYANNFKDGDDVLDVCSSWVSHYPGDWKGGNVVGLGMNEYELSKNERLSSYVVRDLNEDPIFPYPDDSFDAVTCVVSVDYLNKPREVFDEIARVLRPGGTCHVSMSNRCFPTKAFRIWLRTNDLEHIFIVGSFFHYAGGEFEPATCEDISPNPGRSDPMYVVRATKRGGV